MEPNIPLRKIAGSPHIICDDSSYTILSTGQKVTTLPNGAPLEGTALAQALRYHGFPGVVVQVFGYQYRGIKLNGPNLTLVNTVVWENGPVRDVTIIGGEPNKAAKMGGISVFDKTGDIQIENMTLMNQAGATTPFIVTSKSLVGCMRLYDVKFDAEDPSSWNGKGMKWNMLGHGSAQWDCRNLEFHAAVEHGAYIDNHQGDSYFIRCYGKGMGRTMFQFTNRSKSGPPAHGDLVLMKCHSQDIKGDGGSDFTIVGNGEGTVWILDCKSFGALDRSQGAMVHWTDFGHGAYLTSNGFSTKRLIVSNFQAVHPEADRDHMTISGVEEVIIDGWDISGNRVAIQLNSDFGGGIKNGKVWLKHEQPSQSTGWKTPVKMRDGKIKLTDPQIDALKYLGPDPII